MRETMLVGSVEARAFFRGARKIRYFDTVQEADDWLLSLRAQHEGCATEAIDHRAEMTSEPTASKPAAVDVVSLLDAAREDANRG